MEKQIKEKINLRGKFLQKALVFYLVEGEFKTPEQVDLLHNLNLFIKTSMLLLCIAESLSGHDLPATSKLQVCVSEAPANVGDDVVVTMKIHHDYVQAKENLRIRRYMQDLAPISRNNMKSPFDRVNSRLISL